MVPAITLSKGQTLQNLQQVIVASSITSRRAQSYAKLLQLKEALQDFEAALNTCSDQKECKVIQNSIKEVTVSFSST